MSPAGQIYNAGNVLAAQNRNNGRFLWPQFLAETLGAGGFDNGNGLPQIRLIGNGPAPTVVNDYNQWFEYFNQDIYSYTYTGSPSNGQDYFYGLSQYYRAFILPDFTVNTINPVVNSAIGLGWGTVINSVIPGTQIHIGMRLNLFTQTFESVICNKYGAVGHKKFITTIPLTNVPAIANFVNYKIEMLYTPNVSVQYKINDQLQLTFTDALVAPDTPLADIYTNRGTVGATLSGAGYYIATGNDATSVSYSTLILPYTETYR